eukprot:5654419-Amphidinium_carterae.1
MRSVGRCRYRVDFLAASSSHALKYTGRTAPTAVMQSAFASRRQSPIFAYTFLDCACTPSLKSTFHNLVSNTFGKVMVCTIFMNDNPNRPRGGCQIPNKKQPGK